MSRARRSQLEKNRNKLNFYEMKVCLRELRVCEN